MISFDNEYPFLYVVFDPYLRPIRVTTSSPHDFLVRLLVERQLLDAVPGRSWRQDYVDGVRYYDVEAQDWLPYSEWFERYSQWFTPVEAREKL